MHVCLLMVTQLRGRLGNLANHFRKEKQTSSCLTSLAFPKGVLEKLYSKKTQNKGNKLCSFKEMYISYWSTFFSRILLFMPKF